MNSIRSGRGFGAVMLLAALTFVAPPAHAATVAAADTINKAALGSGGGQFCDLTRTSLLDADKADLATSMFNHDTAKMKTYFDKSAALIPKLISSAPASIKDAVVLSLKKSSAMVDAMKKANYDFAKVDRVAFAALSRSTPATTAAQVKMNGFLKSTCHLDMAKALGQASATASSTPSK